MARWTQWRGYFRGECLGVQAAKYGWRHETLEPIRQAVKHVFGEYEAKVPNGLLVQHDHGVKMVAKRSSLS